MKSFHVKRSLALALGLAVFSAQAWGQATTEYRVKAGFLYNFVSFTEWPPMVGNTLSVCVHGADPFGDELDALQGKAVGPRTIVLRRTVSLDQLRSCHVVFVSESAIGNLPRILASVQGEPVLTIADSPGALDAGVGINMELRQGKIAFEVNLPATRSAQLNLSSKLLRLASRVRQ